MFVVQTFDPYLHMGETVAWAKTDEEALSFIMETYSYWANDMTAKDPDSPYDMPYGTKVTLNVDHVAFPTTYFMAITLPEEYARKNNYPLVQVDVFNIIRDDLNYPEGDVTDLGGTQCYKCGAVNVASPDMTLKDVVLEDDITPVIPSVASPIKPVYRQALDGINTLCDDCADNQWKA